MKNILAAIDFSDCSINALEHAISIAVKGLFTVHMVWVNNPIATKTTIYSDSSSELIDEVKDQFTQQGVIHVLEDRRIGFDLSGELIGKIRIHIQTVRFLMFISLASERRMGLSAF